MSDTEDSSPVEIPTKLSTSITSLKSTLAPLLSKPWSETVDDLSPLERAKVDVMMAYTLVDLVWVYLKTRGIDPSTHPVTAELERVKEYYAKIRKVEHPEAEKPRARLDIPAAQRFINHAIPKSQHLKLDNCHNATAAPTSAAGAAAASAARAVAEQDAARAAARGNRSGERAQMQLDPSNGTTSDVVVSAGADGVELAYSSKRYKADRFRFIPTEAESLGPGAEEDDGAELTLFQDEDEKEEEEEEEMASSSSPAGPKAYAGGHSAEDEDEDEDEDVDMDADAATNGEGRRGSGADEAETFLASLRQEFDAEAETEAGGSGSGSSRQLGSGSGSGAGKSKKPTRKESGGTRNGKRKRPTAK